MLNKFKKIFKGRRSIFTVGLILGVIVSASGVYAANTVYSKNVTYDNSNSGMEATNVQDALDETYNACLPPTLLNRIKAGATLDTDIDFSEVSGTSNGKGVYIREGTENNDNPIYYYRGAVTNNNVIFADTCWKIVRTTETGGIKIIYNGLPSDSGTCDNTGSDSQIGTKAFISNSGKLSLPGVGYMYGETYYNYQYSMSDDTTAHYYGNNVTYSYPYYTLNNTIFADWSSIYSNELDNYHYTCFSSSSTTCSFADYIYRATSSAAYFLTLESGETITDALSKMLDYNTNSSLIKGDKSTDGTLDNWYYTNIEQKGYSKYVEDTVWCNDRNISELGSWDPNGGSTGYDDLKFDSYVRLDDSSDPIPSLSCSSTTDSFTVNSNIGNGALDYPVGLITADEITLAGGSGFTNRSYYLYTGSPWWSITPATNSGSFSYNFIVSSSGALGTYTVSYASGVRPTISLVPGIEINGGNGTVENPYVIKTT